MPRTKPWVEPDRLLATLEKVEQTYYASEDREHDGFDDEAILEIIGKIQEVSPRHKRHLGRQIEMSFACSRRFKNYGSSTEGRPFLLNVNLRRNRCSFMAYIPADAFWALPSLIASSTVTHIELRLGDYHHGCAHLLSIAFAPLSKLATQGPAN